MTLWNNDDKYINTYWNKFQGFYYSGDFALLDQDNYIWLLGRSDDVLKIAGHRLVHGIRECICIIQCNSRGSL